MAITKTNVTHTTPGTGFDAGSQVMNAPTRSLLVRVVL